MVKSEIISKLSKKIHQKLKKSELEEILNIVLETIILLKQMSFKIALKTALGMSFISMIGMELAMNITDAILTGGAILTWWAIPIMLFVGFITPLPYNYWRLKKYNVSCH